MTMPEWGDDRGEGGYVEVRCAAPTETLANCDGDDEDGDPEYGTAGCGWTGTVRCIKSWGLWQWEIENCPNCDGEIALAKT